VKNDETCRYDKHRAKKLSGLSIWPELVGYPNEFLSTLLALGRIRPLLEGGRNAGAHPGRKQIRGFGKTADFKEATICEFRNVVEIRPTTIDQIG
jgi:hypothetical protein